MSVLKSFDRPRRRAALGSILAMGLAAAATSVVVSALPAQAVGQKVVLRALVVTSGDPATVALATELDREGIPYTSVSVTAPGRPTINSAFLEDAATGTARFQAVFLPNQAGGGLAPAEVTALSTYEAAYGIRQVNGYDYPGATMGMAAPTFAGTLDGAPATVTPAGLSGPFSYLAGSFGLDNFDPAATETYGYLAGPAASLPAGQTFTPLLTATAGGSTGVLAGVFAHDGREELVLPEAFNQYMQWFNEVAPGIVSWATRGIHLGYQRNYFNVHVDDVFLPDSRWSVSGNCTPGDDCVGNVTTTDIRMTAADVTKLVAWQTAHGFKLDMVFNADGSVLAGGATDPLTTAFLANKAQFPWINHTYSHQYLGCIQIAPTVVGQTWHCATSATEAPRQDPDIPQTLSGTLYWHSQAGITSQVSQNIAWATANGLTAPNFDPKELVTGEHSGLASLPQMPTDNPFLAPALSALGVQYTASDASREVEPRTLAGNVTVTVPRHPTNIYYNAGLFQDEVDEYNWYYTSKANGGSGICEGNASSTCITPLAAGDNAAAATSFNSYIKPIEVRNALKYVLTNDPRPFYAHQSNLAQDAVLYPVLEGVLSAYNGVYNTSTTPIKQTNMTGQYQAMSRISGWRAVNGAVDGYVDSAGVHVPTSSAAVPVTVPAASTGGTLEAYAGSLSGWVSGGATITPPTPAGGYLVKAPATAPGAPTIGTAAPGSTTATVAWTAPASDGGSAITGYTVRGYVGAATTPSITANVAAGLTGTVVTGLTNGTSYRFDVAAVNTVGTGAYSAISAAVTPNVALAPVPGNATAKPGNASATVAWVAPTTTSGVTGYQIRAFAGASTTASKTVTVAAGRLTASVAGLTNGTGYTFDVSSLYGTSAGPASARSVAVTPSLISQAPGAPSIAGVAPANTAATVTWVPPVDSGAGTPSGYRVAAYVGTGTTAARTVTVAGTASTATVTGLTNGTGYTFEVTVQYSAGNGPISARSAAVVPAPSAPPAPAIGTAGSGSTGGAITATARWSAPASNGGSPITGYQVNALALAANGSVVGTTTSGLQPSSSRSYSMTLPSAGQYAFTVVAVNAAGTGAPSATSNTVTGR